LASCRLGLERIFSGVRTCSANRIELLVFGANGRLPVAIRARARKMQKKRKKIGGGLFSLFSFTGGNYCQSRLPQTATEMQDLRKSTRGNSTWAEMVGESICRSADHPQPILAIDRCAGMSDLLRIPGQRSPPDPLLPFMTGRFGVDQLGDHTVLVEAARRVTFTMLQERSVVSESFNTLRL
jgi:hypothetical protein